MISNNSPTVANESGLLDRLRGALQWIDRHQAKVKDVQAHNFYPHVELQLVDVDELRRLFPGHVCQFDHQHDLDIYELLVTPADAPQLKIRAYDHHKDSARTKEVTL